MVRLKKLCLGLCMVAILVLAIGHRYITKPALVIFSPKEIHNQIRDMRPEPISRIEFIRHQPQTSANTPLLIITSNYSQVRKPSADEPATARPPLAGVIPVGVNIRPFITNPEKYALDMARLKIRLDLYGVQALRDYRTNGTKYVLPPLDVKRKQIILLTYWRSGSTFLGDLLNHYPGTFYHFEPVHSISGSDVVNNTELQDKAVSLLEDLLTCKYDNLQYYLRWVQKPENQFLFWHNTRLWNSCRMRARICYQKSFVSALCREHPIQLMKITRLSLLALRPIFQALPDLSVVVLVRDPRGTLSSRKTLDWCNATKSCIDPERVCGQMEKDLSAITELRKDFPDQLLLLRYEDVSVEPTENARRLFKFLGMDLHQHVLNFIRTHTKLRVHETDGGPYSTRRNSKTAPFAWRQKLSYPEVIAIQERCVRVLSALGYELITSEEELKNLPFKN